MYSKVIVSYLLLVFKYTQLYSMEGEIIIDFITIATSALTSLATNFLASPQAGPIKTLNSLWYLALGNIDEKAEDKKYKRALEREATNVHKFKEEAVKYILEIKPEDLKDPDFSLAGPIIEATKYYMGNKEIRSYFSRLLAASMDRSKENTIHPSYVETVKQISSNEAMLLNQLMNTLGFLLYSTSNFYEKKSSQGVGLSEPHPCYFYKHNDNSTTIYNSDGNFDAYYYIEKADHTVMSILEKLNLISIKEMDDSDITLVYKNTNLKKSFANKIESHQYFRDYYDKLVKSFDVVEVEHKIKSIELTSYGWNFANLVCPRDGLNKSNSDIN